ncbi:MAG: hypothetical protein JSV88_02830 [Candidatus Aminicenantes bacterium]|nr:MAG: hypothetical protein JSV88_02830 [Candidatus Aminicenantes bacterium]
MKNKIKITHDDLNHPKIDEIISFMSSGKTIYKREDKKPGGIWGFICRHWLHLLITALIGALIVLILLKILFSLHPGEEKLENDKDIITVRANNEVVGYYQVPEKLFLKSKKEEKWVVV